VVREKNEGIQHFCCRVHVKMMELKDGLNSMRRGRMHKNSECQCEVCRPVPGGLLCTAAH
jgi:hypothetical protein